MLGKEHAQVGHRPAEANPVAGMDQNFISIPKKQVPVFVVDVIVVVFVIWSIEPKSLHMLCKY